MKAGEHGPPVTLRLEALEAALAETIRGKSEVVRLSLVCLISKGHLLIEESINKIFEVHFTKEILKSLDFISFIKSLRLQKSSTLHWLQ